MNRMSPKPLPESIQWNSFDDVVNAIQILNDYTPRE